MAVYSEPRKVPSVKSARGIPLDAGAVVFIVALVALAFMVVLPLGWLLFTSVQTGDTGRFTLGNYVEAFTKSIYLAPIVNSLILASGVATIAVLIGAPLAWLVARTDVPARGLLRTLVVAAFVTPSFLGAQAWICSPLPTAAGSTKRSSR